MNKGFAPGRDIRRAAASGQAPGDAPKLAKQDPVTFAFLLVQRFSMISFASAIEPLRLVNRMLGHDAYRWTVLSPDGATVEASNGISVPADGSYDDLGSVGAAVVCAGVDVHDVNTRALEAKLRGLRSRGIAIGAVCTGTYVLARAGLLDGYRCTVHWENFDALRESFPELDLTQELFELDRSRFTCAGGTASIDMMLSLIVRHHGDEVANRVLDQLIHHRMRGSHEHQRMELRSRLGIAHPKLITVIADMERCIEEPLSCAELAERVGLTTRQIERLFDSYLGEPPMRYYLGLRLDRASRLLRQTTMPIVAVGLACGFVSASHFSKCFQDRFSHTPSAERRAQRIRRETPHVSGMSHPL